MRVRLLARLCRLVGVRAGARADECARAHTRVRVHMCLCVRDRVHGRVSGCACACM